MVSRVRIFALFALVVLVFPSCDEEERPSALGTIYMQTSEEEGVRNTLFYDIIFDFDHLGRERQSLDSFIVDGIISSNNEDTLYLKFTPETYVEVDDSVLLSNGELKFKNRLGISEMYRASPVSGTQYAYIEFGYVQHDEVINCCIYSYIYSIDTTSNSITLSFLSQSNRDYIIRLKSCC